MASRKPLVLAATGQTQELLSTDDLGAPNALTAAAGTSTSQVATTAFVSGALGGLGAWTQTTGSVYSTGGTMTTASSVIRYLKIGRMVIVNVVASIGNNGSGTGVVVVNMPFAPASASVISGEDTALNGKAAVLRGSAGNAGFLMLYYDNSYAGTTGTVFAFNGIYESTT